MLIGGLENRSNEMGAGGSIDGVGTIEGCRGGMRGCGGMRGGVLFGPP